MREVEIKQEQIDFHPRVHIFDKHVKNSGYTLDGKQIYLLDYEINPKEVHGIEILHIKNTHVLGEYLFCLTDSFLDVVYIKSDKILKVLPTLNIKKNTLSFSNDICEYVEYISNHYISGVNKEKFMGINKTVKRLKKFEEKLVHPQLNTYIYLKQICNGTNIYRGVSLAKVFNHHFATVNSFESFIQAIPIGKNDLLTEFIETLPIFQAFCTKKRKSRVEFYVIQQASRVQLFLKEHSPNKYVKLNFCNIYNSEYYSYQELQEKCEEGNIIRKLRHY